MVFLHMHKTLAFPVLYMETYNHHTYTDMVRSVCDIIHYWTTKSQNTMLEQMDWTFNPLTDAWWGGWRECLVRLLQQ